uniref:EF-hand domain-containing protein n=1 Tax=Globodera rostochiensis TaxID=31243 RepID=A0A914GWB9_GLORO
MQFMFVMLCFIGLCFFAKIFEVLPCSHHIYHNDCCGTGLGAALTLNSIKCGITGNCDFFGWNCAVCESIFDPSDNCKLIRKCSCYYCCDPAYKNDCPQGCDGCVQDGNGCPGTYKEEKFPGCHGGGQGQSRSGGNVETSFSTLARISKARMAFNKIDANKDGYISKEEAFNEASKNADISPEIVEKKFKGMDKNGNQKIEPAEFDVSLS